MGIPAETLGITNGALSGDRRELSRQLQAQVVNPIARLMEDEGSRCAPASCRSQSAHVHVNRGATRFIEPATIC